MQKWFDGTALQGANCSCSRDWQTSEAAMLGTGWYVPGGMGPQARPHHWLHTCFSYSAPAGQLTIYLNGLQLPLAPVTMEQPGGRRAGRARLERLRLGRSPKETPWLIGRTADIHIYSRAVGEEEAGRFAECRLGPGDLLDWATVNISLHSTRARLTEVAAGQLCSARHHVFPLPVPAPRHGPHRSEAIIAYCLSQSCPSCGKPAPQRCSSPGAVRQAGLLLPPGAAQLGGALQRNHPGGARLARHADTL